MICNRASTPAANAASHRNGRPRRRAISLGSTLGFGLPLVLGMSVAFVSTACDRPEPSPAEMPTPVQPGARTTPAPAPPVSDVPPRTTPPTNGAANDVTNDAEMTRRVQEALSEATGLTSDVTDLEVTTQDGRTFVTGTVATTEDRERVLEIIRTVALAPNVESEIRVVPPR